MTPPQGWGGRKREVTPIDPPTTVPMAPPNPPPMPPEGTKIDENVRNLHQTHLKMGSHTLFMTFPITWKLFLKIKKKKNRVFKHFHTRLVTKKRPKHFFFWSFFLVFFHFFDQSTSLFDAFRFLVGKPRGGLPQKTVLNRSRTVSMPHQIGQEGFFFRKCWVFGATPRDNSREWSLRGSGGSDLSLAG